MDEEGATPVAAPHAGRWLAVGLVVLLVAAFVAYRLLGPGAGPPPASIASDPELVRGREVFLARCASCHGEAGKGDGPIAKNLQGPPVGDLTDPDWKHGDRPEQIRAVVERGVKDTAMAAWRGMISEGQLDAVVAYVEYLGGLRRPRAEP